MSEPKRSGECIYCGRIGPITDDHVPPRSFYPDPPPPNLITVPSCEDCNKSFSSDDDYVRLVLSIDESSRGSDRKRLLPKVKRFAERRESRRMLSEFHESIHWVWHPNSRGLYVIGRRFTVDGKKLDAFAKRVVKALFYREKGYRLPDGLDVNPVHHQRRSEFTGDTKDFLDFIIETLLAAPLHSWGTTFGYRWVQSPNGPNLTWWMLELYGVGRYVCSTTNITSAGEGA